MSPVGKRLPKEVITLIKTQKSSYKEIQDNVERLWKTRIPKSTVSYYRRQQARTKAIDLEAVSREDWDWLQGLFSADGNKTLNRRKYGKHYIIRISLSMNDDSAIAKKCMRILRTIGPKPMVVPCGNCIQVRVSSKGLYFALDKKPPEDGVSPAYVAGAIDGDGTVDHHAIQFGQSRVPELFDGIALFFRRSGTPVSTWSTKNNYRRMYISYQTLKKTLVLSFSLRAQRIRQSLGRERGDYSDGAGEI